MKKRVLVLVLVCLLAVGLAACGAAAETETAQETQASTVEAGPEEQAAAPVEEPEAPAAEEEAPVVEEMPAEPEEPAGPTVEDALAFVDQDVNEMIAAIGEPISSTYEYSCSGPGDDGVLQYDGFIVFTYREPDQSAETVIDAE